MLPTHQPLNPLLSPWTSHLPSPPHEPEPEPVSPPHTPPLSPTPPPLPQHHKDGRLLLCVGGQLLETSRQTLCADSHSMLAAWVLRHTDEDSNALWIDRDAKRFKHVLNYLRNGTIWLEDVASLRAVQEEAAFFGLMGLEALCEERIRNVRAKEEAMLKNRTEEMQDALRHMFENHLFRCSLPSFRAKGEVVAVLRGRILGSGDVDEPRFQMDAGF